MVESLTLVQQLLGTLRDTFPPFVSIALVLGLFVFGLCEVVSGMLSSDKKASWWGRKLMRAAPLGIGVLLAHTPILDFVREAILGFRDMDLSSRYAGGYGSMAGFAAMGYHAYGLRPMLDTLIRKSLRRSLTTPSAPDKEAT